MTLTAGEIIALLEGKRAVVMVQVCEYKITCAITHSITQLWVGWTPDAPQPVFRPFVLRLLRTAVLDPRIAVHMSAVPVGAELGLTAILAADTAPYCAWGAGLAEFGAQAAIEAQSPYYKLLIGRVLGYEMDNIRAHVEVMLVCGVATAGCPLALTHQTPSCASGRGRGAGAGDGGHGGQRAGAPVGCGASAAVVASTRPRGHTQGGGGQEGWHEEKGRCWGRGGLNKGVWGRGKGRQTSARWEEKVKGNKLQ